MPRGRAPQRGLELLSCPVCTQQFQPYRESQQTCSRTCQREARSRGLTEPTRAINISCVFCGSLFISAGPKAKYCAECRAEAERRKRHRANLARRGSEQVREYNRKKQLERYGVTVEQHDAMLEEQRGLCALCGNPPKPDGIRAASRLHLDHDHGTGKPRQLLCNTCNQGLGYLKDDPELLRAAADYIERHRQS